MEPTTYKSRMYRDYKAFLEYQLKSHCITMRTLLEVQSYQASEAYNDTIARYHELIQDITTEMVGLDEAEFAKSRQEQSEQA